MVVAACVRQGIVSMMVEIVLTAFLTISFSDILVAEII